MLAECQRSQGSWVSDCNDNSAEILCQESSGRLLFGNCEKRRTFVSSNRSRVALSLDVSHYPSIKRITFNYFLHEKCSRYLRGWHDATIRTAESTPSQTHTLITEILKRNEQQNVTEANYRLSNRGRNNEHTFMNDFFMICQRGLLSKGTPANIAFVWLLALNWAEKEKRK